MDTFDLLKRLSEASGISGYESPARELVVAELGKFSDETRIDKMGSVIARKAARGFSAAAGSIMIAAHLDEIGLIVTGQDKSFLRFSTVGGFDRRVLLGQHVLVHGTETLPGIIGTRPPHVVPAEERGKVTRIEEMVIDTGLDDAYLSQSVRVGDVVSLQREVVALQNDLASGKAFDNRASLVALITALNLLSSVDHSWDVYAVATVQEEVGLRGATTATFGISPGIAIAVDVSFGEMGGLASWQTRTLGSGPAISMGPNIHPWIHSELVRAARDHEIPHQVLPEPGDTGTDAWAMQVSTSGIPTGVLGIPLRYMHTTVETVSLKDIERTARLLVAFITSLTDDTMERLAFKI